MTETSENTNTAMDGHVISGKKTISSLLSYSSLIHISPANRKNTEYIFKAIIDMVDASKKLKWKISKILSNAILNELT